MDDAMIVSLFWERDETAILETEKKYGRYLAKIAYGILADMEDSRESVNDTYYKAWASMPPHRPGILSTFLAKITRQTAIDIFRKRNSQKRRNTEYALSLSELEECVSDGAGPEQEFDYKLLIETINAFLRSLSPQARNIFLRRYFFVDSIRDVARYCDASESNVKVTLHRTRFLLKAQLEKEGFPL